MEKYNNAIDEIFKEAKVEDSTDVWKVIREYILSRTSNRYDTLQEMQDNVNEKYKVVMEQIQSNYDRWFDTELLSNYSLYGIEILGKEEDVIIEETDQVDEIEDVDEMSDEITEDDFEKE